MTDRVTARRVQWGPLSVLVVGHRGGHSSTKHLFLIYVYDSINWSIARNHDPCTRAIKQRATASHFARETKRLKDYIMDFLAPWRQLAARWGSWAVKWLPFFFFLLPRSLKEEKETSNCRQREDPLSSYPPCVFHHSLIDNGKVPPFVLFYFILFIYFIIIFFALMSTQGDNWLLSQVLI